VPPGNTPGSFNGQGENEDQRFNRMLTPTQLQGSRAGTLGNRDFVVAMGTSIPCVLETALSSDQPGFTSCVINRDVLSDNGRVVLMEKGTQVVGEYRGGVRRGQKRLFVLWNRAKTPKGVIITLASPATDALGRAGVDGYIDTHWWERFGSAILLSIVGDASSYASSRLQDSDVEAQNTTSAGQQAAAIAVEQSINIPPTLMKHQGELVSIFVARDLDFSTAYRLRVTEPRNRIYDRAVLGDFSPASKLVTK
jgi:type IV secretion system protein VirB10